MSKSKRFLAENILDSFTYKRCGYQPRRRSRITRKRLLIGNLCVILLFIALAFSPKVHAMTVQVFTTSKMPAQVSNTPGVNVEVYELDGIQAGVMELNKRLENLPLRVAYRVAQERIQEQMPEFKNDFNGIKLAQKYDIQALPTYVFNGKQEIVGGTLSEALQEYDQWQNS